MHGQLKSVAVDDLAQLALVRSYLVGYLGELGFGLRCYLDEAGRYLVQIDLVLGEAGLLSGLERPNALGVGAFPLL